MSRALQRRSLLRAALPLLLGLRGGPLRAQAREPRHRVGMLTLSSLATALPFLEQYRSAMRELGYVEGRDVAYELLSADGQQERLPGLAQQLVARKVDLIVAGAGNVSARAARQATASIPILLSSGIGVVESGLAQSLARPGGTITGINLPEQLGMMQVQLLRELIPSLSRLGILMRLDPQGEERRAATREMARSMLGLQMDYVGLDGPQDLGRALEALRSGRPQAVIVAPDALLYQLREPILQFLRAQRIPDMHFIASDVEDGGLVSFSPSLKEMLGTLARMSDRLLKGARPEQMPFEQPTRFEIAVNQKTARALGLTIPQSVLLRADRVIE